MKHMKTIRNLLSALLMLGAALSAQASGLTEQTVEQFLKTMDAAIARKDSDSVAGLMSSTVAIRMSITAGGKTQTLTPTRQEYLKLMKEGWAISTDYRYSRSGVKINLADSAKAVVTATVRESMKVQGQQINGLSEEEVTIEMVEGKPLITKVVGNSKM
jgi:hypothetical protein